MGENRLCVLSGALDEPDGQRTFRETGTPSLPTMDQGIEREVDCHGEI